MKSCDIIKSSQRFNNDNPAFLKIFILLTVSKTYTFGARKRRLHVDGGLKRRKNISVFENFRIRGNGPCTVWPSQPCYLHLLYRTIVESFKVYVPFRNISIFNAKRCRIIIQSQRANKVASDSPRLADFATGLVIFVLNLPDGQVLFFEEEGL